MSIVKGNAAITLRTSRIKPLWMNIKISLGQEGTNVLHSLRKRMTELRVKGKCWIGSATTSTITRKNRSVKSGGEKQNVMRPGSTANASADFKSKPRISTIAASMRPRQLDRALREVRVMSQLDHPHIVRYNSTWMEEPPEFWQLCHTSLEQWLKDNQDPASRSRDLSSMKLWFKQIVPAVAYIHVKKLLHRDLKPSNILISEDGRLKVCDLGIASEQRLENGMEVVVTRTYKSCTELYRSPEQVEFIAWITEVDPDCRPTCSEILNSEFLRAIHYPIGTDALAFRGTID
ncbi:hypothetical protein PRIPAC_88419, partial [Pristionchus pacificus]